MWKFRYFSLYTAVIILVFFNFHNFVVDIQTVLENRSNNQEAQWKKMFWNF